MTASPRRYLQYPVNSPEEGFALIALIVAIFVILLFLSIAAPKVARDLRRDRELEAVQRGNQYVRAIQLYYKKFGHYPGSIEQLEKTNNIRFLRKQYDDPITGKPDWRLILVGQNKTTVKGLFGQPLAGLPGVGGGGLGTTPGASTAGAAGASQGTAFGGSSSTATGPSNGTSTSGFGASTTGQTGTSAGSSTSTFGSGNSGSSAAGGLGSQSATDFKGTGGPFMGVGHAVTGNSIITLNEQTDYGTWEFLYDPRIEQLKSKSNLFGGGAATSATSPSLSNTFGSSPAGAAAPTAPGTTATPATPPTTQP